MLSDEQIWQLASQEGDTHDDSFIFNRDGRWSVLSFARAIESALSQSTEQGERDARLLTSEELLEVLEVNGLRAAMSPHGDGVNYTRAEGGEDDTTGKKVEGGSDGR